MATASLLTAQQRKLCQTQSNQPAPNGPRAKALLALDEGNTQQQAAEASGLSLGQVRYCLRRFRTVALDLFDPATPTANKPAAKTVTAATTDGATASKPAKDNKKSKNKKDDKKGKAKKKDKKLKPIKPKTDKGDKKSKKKDKKGDGKKGKKKSKKK